MSMIDPHRSIVVPDNPAPAADTVASHPLHPHRERGRYVVGEAFQQQQIDEDG
jgi:hypothetical protein